MDKQLTYPPLNQGNDLWVHTQEKNMVIIINPCHNLS